MIFRQLAAGAALFIAAIAPARADDVQFWSALAVNGPVKQDSRLLLWFDGHARFRDDAGELGVSIIRPAVGWRVSDRLDLWLGYARVTNHLDGPDIGEDRIWQQATYPIVDVFGGTISGRTRIEQRFRDTGTDTGHRIRQFVRWSRPLAQSPDISLVLWDEVFVGLNDADWGQRSGYDQNRAFGGIGWRLVENARVELGYLNNHIGGGPFAPDVMNHNVSLSLFIGL